MLPFHIVSALCAYSCTGSPVNVTGHPVASAPDPRSNACTLPSAAATYTRLCDRSMTPVDHVPKTPFGPSSHPVKVCVPRLWLHRIEPSAVSSAANPPALSPTYTTLTSREPMPTLPATIAELKMTPGSCVAHASFRLATF